jgi:hypothetical protein
LSATWLSPRDYCGIGECGAHGAQLLQHPRRAIRARKHGVGFVVVNKVLGGRIPTQAPAQLHGDIGQMTAGRRTVPNLGRTDWLLAAADAGQEVRVVVVTVIKPYIVVR